MPAERALVPDSPDISTHNEVDIHLDAAHPADSDSGTAHSGTRHAGTRDSGTRDSGTRDSGTRDSGTCDSGTARPGLRLLLILVASFMVVLDFTIVNIALPSMERDFGVTTPVVQWVVTGYAIAFSGLLILCGRAADLLGRRRVFISGLVLFSLASLAGGLAGDPVLLIVARIVQGAGAALVAPAALSLITTSFPPGPQRTRAIGLYGSMASVGFVAGQVLGGVLVEWTSWRAVFLVNVPVGLAAAFLAPRVIAGPAAAPAKAPAADRARVPAPDPAPLPALGPAVPARAGRLDVRGAVLITGAVALAVFGISQGDVLGWTSPLVLGAAVIALATAAFFVAAEKHHPAPLIRPRLLLRPGLRNGAMLAFLLGVWNGGELLVLSLYMQQVLHLSPLVTGLAIAPQGLAGFTMGMLGPKLAGRFGVRRVAMFAGLSATIGFAALTRLPAGGYSPLLFVVILIGFGGAGTAFGSIVLASRELSDGDQGLAGGVVNTSRQVGAAVGAALLPAVADAVSGVSGDRYAMLAATAAALAATAVSWQASRRAAAPMRSA
jgi:MFS family permease